MSSFALNIDDIVYEEYDDKKIAEFEKLGEEFSNNIDSRKKIIQRKIARVNLESIEEKVLDELESDEIIQLKFKGVATAVGYLNSMLFSADYYVIPTAFRDVGSRYIVYSSNEKVMIYETRELNKLQREYIVRYEDIKKYYYKHKKGYTKLYFKIKKDKYDELRECSNWLLYGYLHGRINMTIDSKERVKIAKYFDEKIKNSSNEL